ncbi:MAG: mechanosensitive ion channel [Desulfocapsaceae bacterium]|nr:mechanosensitive ion channel [Desulfocapsaceae bacterium]
MQFEFNMETIQTLLITYGTKVVLAILVFIIGKWLAGKICSILASLMEKNNVDQTLVKFLRNILYYLLLAAVLVAVAGQLGINTASFLTIIGAASLAIGLALKDSLSNFSAGVMLILFRPFKVGDYIDAGGESGTVDEISIFNTILNTPDNQRKIIPNGAIASSTITNVTAYPTRRMDLVIGVGYDDDLQKTKKILEDIIAGRDDLLKDPAPTVAVAELADSSVNFVVRPWVKTSDYWGVRFQLIEQIKTTLDENGISIPYPQRDVHLLSEEKN